MSTPADRNRLDEEVSPYLRQHADNPVAWQPWDEVALEAARERDVPIFLSVGYAACHWCHVMEEESFVDDAVAEVLNDEFVPIKVDREERPDVDRIYQTACQLVSGRGGWPLSAWLTPDGEPFHVGTYFPRESRGRMPGFLDLLEDLTASWNDPEDREQLETRADRITSRVRSELEDVPTATGDAQAMLGTGRGGGSDDVSTDRPGGGAFDTAGDGSTSDESTHDESTHDGSTRDDLATPSPVERVANEAVRSADGQHGGWGSGPKFPQPVRVEALLEAGATTAQADVQFHDVATAVLAAMVDGGLYDHVGGGFHRYCTDREWVVPHFEKMLYDNAELPRVLLAAHQVTGRERYATVVRETFEFLDRELAQPDGAFASTLDARSPVPPERTDDGQPGEHEEGAYYVWTPEEVATALEGVDAPALLADARRHDPARDAEYDLDDVDLHSLVCERYGVTDAGNFEGRTVLTVGASLQSLAATYDLEPATVRALLDGARDRLRKHRAERPRPRRDDKVIAAWNGLAIRSLAEGSIVLDDEELADRARDALDAVVERLWGGERLARRYVLDDGGGTSMHHSGTDGSVDTEPITADVQGVGYLEDYAFLGRGALACYEATGDVETLALALDLGQAIVDQFYDDTAGTLYATPEHGESLIARPQEPRDQSTPSSLGVGADLLAALDAFRTDDEFTDVAERVVRTHASAIDQSPLEYPSLALAAQRLRSGSTEVTVAAESSTSGDDTAAGSSRAVGLAAPWRSWIGRTFLPRRLLAPRPPTDDGLAEWLDVLDLETAPSIWAGREARDGPTAFVCRNFTCSRPLFDPHDATAWLD